MATNASSYGNDFGYEYEGRTRGGTNRRRRRAADGWLAVTLGKSSLNVFIVSFAIDRAVPLVLIFLKTTAWRFPCVGGLDIFSSPWNTTELSPSDPLSPFGLTWLGLICFRDSYEQLTHLRTYAPILGLLVVMLLFVHILVVESS
jgi:hypothetical protein